MLSGFYTQTDPSAPHMLVSRVLSAPSLPACLSFSSLPMPAIPTTGQTGAPLGAALSGGGQSSAENLASTAHWLGGENVGLAGVSAPATSGAVAVDGARAGECVLRVELCLKSRSLTAPTRDSTSLSFHLSSLHLTAFQPTLLALLAFSSSLSNPTPPSPFSALPGSGGSKRHHSHNREGGSGLMGTHPSADLSLFESPSSSFSSAASSPFNSPPPTSDALLSPAVLATGALGMSPQRSRGRVGVGRQGMERQSARVVFEKVSGDDVTDAAAGSGGVASNDGGTATQTSSSLRPAPNRGPSTHIVLPAPDNSGAGGTELTLDGRVTGLVVRLMEERDEAALEGLKGGAEEIHGMAGRKDGEGKGHVMEVATASLSEALVQADVKHLMGQSLPATWASCGRISGFEVWGPVGDGGRYVPYLPASPASTTPPSTSQLQQGLQQQQQRQVIVGSVWAPGAQPGTITFAAHGAHTGLYGEGVPGAGATLHVDVAVSRLLLVVSQPFTHGLVSHVTRYLPAPSMTATATHAVAGGSGKPASASPLARQGRERGQQEQQSQHASFTPATSPSPSPHITLPARTPLFMSVSSDSPSRSNHHTGKARAARTAIASPATTRLSPSPLRGGIAVRGGGGVKQLRGGGSGGWAGGEGRTSGSSQTSPLGVKGKGKRERGEGGSVGGLGSVGGAGSGSGEGDSWSGAQFFSPVGDSPLRWEVVEGVAAEGVGEEWEQGQGRMRVEGAVRVEGCEIAVIPLGQTQSLLQPSAANQLQPRGSNGIVPATTSGEWRGHPCLIIELPLITANLPRHVAFWDWSSSGTITWLDGREHEVSNMGGRRGNEEGETGRGSTVVGEGNSGNSDDAEWEAVEVRVEGFRVSMATGKLLPLREVVPGGGACGAGGENEEVGWVGERVPVVQRVDVLLHVVLPQAAGGSSQPGSALQGAAQGVGVGSEAASGMVESGGEAAAMGSPHEWMRVMVQVPTVQLLLMDNSRVREADLLSGSIAALLALIPPQPPPQQPSPPIALRFQLHHLHLQITRGTTSLPSSPSSSTHGATPSFLLPPGPLIALLSIDHLRCAAALQPSGQSVKATWQSIALWGLQAGMESAFQQRGSAAAASASGQARPPPAFSQEGMAADAQAAAEAAIGGPSPEGARAGGFSAGEISAAVLEFLQVAVPLFVIERERGCSVTRDAAHTHLSPYLGISLSSTSTPPSPHSLPTTAAAPLSLACTPSPLQSPHPLSQPLASLSLLSQEPPSTPVNIAVPAAAPPAQTRGDPHNNTQAIHATVQLPSPTLWVFLPAWSLLTSLLAAKAPKGGDTGGGEAAGGQRARGSNGSGVREGLGIGRRGAEGLTGMMGVRLGEAGGSVGHADMEGLLCASLEEGASGGAEGEGIGVLVGEIGASSDGGNAAAVAVAAEAAARVHLKVHAGVKVDGITLVLPSQRTSQPALQHTSPPSAPHTRTQQAAQHQRGAGTTAHHFSPGIFPGECGSNTERCSAVVVRVRTVYSLVQASVPASTSLSRAELSAGLHSVELTCVRRLGLGHSGVGHGDSSGDGSAAGAADLFTPDLLNLPPASLNAASLSPSSNPFSFRLSCFLPPPTDAPPPVPAPASAPTASNPPSVRLPPPPPTSMRLLQLAGLQVRLTAAAAPPGSVTGMSADGLDAGAGRVEEEGDGGSGRVREEGGSTLGRYAEEICENNSMVSGGGVGGRSSALGMICLKNLVELERREKENVGENREGGFGVEGHGVERHTPAPPPPRTAPSAAATTGNLGTSPFTPHATLAFATHVALGRVHARCSPEILHFLTSFQVPGQASSVQAVSGQATSRQGIIEGSNGKGTTQKRRQQESAALQSSSKEGHSSSSGSAACDALVVVGVESLVAVVAESEEDSEPLFHLSLSTTAGHALACLPSGHLHASLATTLALHYLNQDKAALEPLCEPWPFQLSASLHSLSSLTNPQSASASTLPPPLLSTSSSSPSASSTALTSLALTSSHPLNLNFTPSLLEDFSDPKYSAPPSAPTSASASALTVPPTNPPHITVPVGACLPLSLSSRLPCPRTLSSSLGATAPHSTAHHASHSSRIPQAQAGSHGRASSRGRATSLTGSTTAAGMAGRQLWVRVGVDGSDSVCRPLLLEGGTRLAFPVSYIAGGSRCEWERGAEGMALQGLRMGWGEDGATGVGLQGVAAVEGGAARVHGTVMLEVVREGRRHRLVLRSLVSIVNSSHTPLLLQAHHSHRPDLPVEDVGVCGAKSTLHLPLHLTASTSLRWRPVQGPWAWSEETRLDDALMAPAAATVTCTGSSGLDSTGSNSSMSAITSTSSSSGTSGVAPLLTRSASSSSISTPGIAASLDLLPPSLFCLSLTASQSPLPLRSTLAPLASCAVLPLPQRALLIDTSPLHNYVSPSFPFSLPVRFLPFTFSLPPVAPSHGPIPRTPLTIPPHGATAAAHRSDSPPLTTTSRSHPSSPPLTLRRISSSSADAVAIAAAAAAQAASLLANPHLPAPSATLAGPASMATTSHGATSPPAIGPSFPLSRSGSAVSIGCPSPVLASSAAPVDGRRAAGRRHSRGGSDAWWAVAGEREGPRGERGGGGEPGAAIEEGMAWEQQLCLAAPLVLKNLLLVPVTVTLICTDQHVLLPTTICIPPGSSVEVFDFPAHNTLHATLLVPGFQESPPLLLPAPPAASTNGGRQGGQKKRGWRGKDGEEGQDRRGEEWQQHKEEEVLLTRVTGPPVPLHLIHLHRPASAFRCLHLLAPFTIVNATGLPLCLSDAHLLASSSSHLFLPPHPALLTSDSLAAATSLVASGLPLVPAGGAAAGGATGGLASVLPGMTSGVSAAAGGGDTRADSHTPAATNVGAAEKGTEARRECSAGGSEEISQERAALQPPMALFTPAPPAPALDADSAASGATTGLHHTQPALVLRVGGTAAAAAAPAGLGDAGGMRSLNAPPPSAVPDWSHVSLSGWSAAIPVEPAGGVAEVLIPQQAGNSSGGGGGGSGGVAAGGGAFALSLTCCDTLGASVGRAKTITLRPRYVLANSLSADIRVKQHGTDRHVLIKAGGNAPIHFTKLQRRLYLSLRLADSSCEWSGAFRPSQLGDTQLKLRCSLSPSSPSSPLALTRIVRVDVSLAEPHLPQAAAPAAAAATHTASAASNDAAAGTATNSTGSGSNSGGNSGSTEAENFGSGGGSGAGSSRGGDGSGKWSGGGTYLVVIGEDDSGFMPFRIDNCCREVLRFYQRGCEGLGHTDSLKPFAATPYAWDEPCRPHRLVLEVPGEGGSMGHFPLDQVKHFPLVVLPATPQREQRRLRVSVSAQGPIRVLSVCDIDLFPPPSSLPPLRLKHLPMPRHAELAFGQQHHQPWNLSSKSPTVPQSSSSSLLELLLSVHIPLIALSVIDARPQELLLLSLHRLSVSLSRSAHQHSLSFLLSHLQLDNQLPNALFPILLASSSPPLSLTRSTPPPFSSPSPSPFSMLHPSHTSPSLALLQAALQTPSLLLSSVLHHTAQQQHQAPSHSALLQAPFQASLQGGQAAVAADVVAWRQRVGSVLCAESVRVGLAPLSLELEEHLLLRLLDFSRTCIAALSALGPPSPSSSPHSSSLASSSKGVGRGWAGNAGREREQEREGARGSPGAQAGRGGGDGEQREEGRQQGQEQLQRVYVWCSGASVAAVGVVGGPGMDTSPHIKGTANMYIETMVILPIHITISFASAPWAADQSRGAAAQGLLGALGAVVQRSVLSLADVQGAPLGLSAWQLEHFFGGPASLGARLERHYTLQLLQALYKVVGSADFLGNPVGLLSSLSASLWDLLASPTHTLLMRRSLAGFAKGVWAGWTSLLRTTLFALSHSASRMSHAASKGMASLAWDEETEEGMERAGQAWAPHASDEASFFASLIQ
ncbi:unnamed protein product, partial [Closterium sp. NIES-54]